MPRSKGLEGRARWQPRLLYWLWISSLFGPYLSDFPGARTEQLVTYTAAGWLLLLALPNPSRLRGMHRLGPVAFGPAAVLFIGVLSSLMGHSAPPQFEGQMASAAVDTLSLPVASLIVVYFLHRRWTVGDPLAFLRRLSRDLPVAMALNSVIALYLANTRNLSLVAAFWAPTQGDVDSVAANAIVLGRSPGIFSQPLEAGLAYSIAGLLCVLAWQKRWTSTGRSLITGTLIVLGGAVAVTKVFLLLGLPAAVFWCLRPGIASARQTQGFRIPRLVAAGVAAVGGWALVILARPGASLQAWTGWRFLRGLLSLDTEQHDLVTLITGGRFGDSATLVGAWDAVMANSPAMGFGLGGVRLAYDSTWIEAAVIGGVMAVTVLVIYYGNLVRLAIRPAEDGLVRRFVILLVAVFLGASLGGPVITANRSGTIAAAVLGAALLTWRPPSRVVAGSACLPTVSSLRSGSEL